MFKFLPILLNIEGGGDDIIQYFDIINYTGEDSYQYKPLDSPVFQFDIFKAMANYKI